jgi:calmodulin
MKEYHLSKNKTDTDEVVGAFQVFDKNNNGVLSIREFKHILTDLGNKFSEEEVEEMFKEVDLDRDVVISKITNEYKAIAMLQELTGNSILECKRMIDLSTSRGEPVIRDLNPGFKNFATKALKLKGVKEFKTK